MNTARIRALTLDLDDTLWPIAPCIVRAEQALHAWLAQHAARTAAAFDVPALRAKRDQVTLERPDLAHDMTALRRESVRMALREAGDDERLAEPAFEVFFAARHEVDFYPDVMAALPRLANRFRIFALSNGNAQIARTALAPWFAGALSAREFGAGKPDPRIFHEACRQLGCAPGETLHVGDDLELDALAARAAGLHALWLRREGGHDAVAERHALDTVACLRSLAERLGC